MSDEQNIQTVRSVYEMFNSRDTNGLMNLVTADDFELIDVPLGLTWTGGSTGWPITLPKKSGAACPFARRSGLISARSIT
jgi:hypothetical protein